MHKPAVQTCKLLIFETHFLQIQKLTSQQIFFGKIFAPIDAGLFKVSYNIS